MSRKPAPFQDNDERDAWRRKVDRLISTAQLLPPLARDTNLARYRVLGLGNAKPRLPSPAEIAQAQHVLERVAECLRDYYRQRVRYDDDPDPWRVTDGSLDDEVSF